MAIPTQNPWAFAFGVLGNITSLVVFLAQVPTFYRVWRRKSTEGFHALPYIAGQLSAMLWLYYGSLHSRDDFLLITINSAGCIIETLYIALYIVYAPKNVRMFTLRLLVLLNFCGFCSILLLSHFLAKGSTRVQVLGAICTSLSVIVFIAPFSVMRLVIRTKSVEFMPFLLSFLLTLSAIAWLLYGITLKDFFVALPNILGLIFGLAQMILYVIYRKPRPLPGVAVEKQLQLDQTPQRQAGQHNNNNNNNNNEKDDSVLVIQISSEGEGHQQVQVAAD